jgi:hypothetical protein
MNVRAIGQDTEREETARGQVDTEKEVAKHGPQRGLAPGCLFLRRKVHSLK